MDDFDVSAHLVDGACCHSSPSSVVVIICVQNGVVTQKSGSPHPCPDNKVKMGKMLRADAILFFFNLQDLKIQFLQKSGSNCPEEMLNVFFIDPDNYSTYTVFC